MQIIQINTSDEGGGAEKITYSLHRVYQIKGYKTGLFVGYKRSDDHTVSSFPNDTIGIWQSFCSKIGHSLSPSLSRIYFIGLVKRLLQVIGQPKKSWEIYQGHENFEFPGIWKVLESYSKKPDIIHCHNMHGDYFDLRALPWLSKQVPIVITMHDAWLLSGHCAHSFDCERWKTGCGQCPDLTINPSIRRDRTAYNWHRKKIIYDNSQFYIATPCNWLMQKVQESMLSSAIIEARVIPNGVDLSIFHPGSKSKSRKELGIDQSAIIILFVANGIRQNIWKDSQTMREAITIVAEQFLDREILFIAVGENAPPEQIGKAEIQFVPYLKNNNVNVIASYYQAADIYLHAAKADTFPTTILEALACGTPVIATSIGGIPEQVRSLQISTIEKTYKEEKWQSINCNLFKTPSYSAEKATGILVPPGDAVLMSDAIKYLINNDTIRNRLGVNAAKDAFKRFDIIRCANDYINWYRDIIEKN